MPRPKRSKVAPSAPTVLPKSKQTTRTAIPGHVSSPKSRTTTNSDDSDGLVKRNLTGKNSRGVARQEVVMSGALPISSGAGSTRQKTVKGRTKKDASNGAQNFASVQSDTRMDHVTNPQSPANVPEIEVPASYPEEDEPLPARAVHSGSPKENVFASAIKRQPSSNALNWRTQATPQADSSMMSLANFKRRPRQPSILGIGRPDESPSLSSLGDLVREDSLLGPREPSKAKALDFTIMDDMSDFEPENESTPFNVAKAAVVSSTPSQSPQSMSRLPSSISRPLRATKDRELYSPGSAFESQIGKVPTSVAGRKRKLSPSKVPEVQVPRSQSSPAPSIHISESSEEADRTAANENNDEPVLPSLKRRAISSSETLSEVMAPPRSSSPVNAQPTTLPDATHQEKKAPAKGRGRPKRNQPIRGTKITGSKNTKPDSSKPLTTATLQAYLPRRRTTKHHGEFDIHSDGSEPTLNDDEDELSYIRPGRRKTGRSILNTNKRVTLTAAKTPKTNARSTTSNTRSSTTKPRSLLASHGVESTKPVRTYGRRLSNKENEPQSPSTGEGDDSNDSLLPAPEGDDSTGDVSMELPQAAQKEMQKLAKKFKEVDDWDLDFEEVTASSSSPKDAR